MDGWAELARPRRTLAAAQRTSARVMPVMQPAFEPAIATGVDLGDLNLAAGADGGADQGRAAVARQVVARAGAGLDI